MTRLPANLTSLYRHWADHVRAASGVSAGELFSDKEMFGQISWFIRERMRIWEQKTAGGKPPFTEDEILGKYRFCNILREMDRQTMEFHELLNPLRDDFALWLMNMFYCRMVARTQTVKQVGLLGFDEAHNREFYKKLMASPRPRYGTPYVYPVSVILKSKIPTRELFISEYVPQVIKRVAKEIEMWDKLSVYEGVKRILPIFGFNLEFLWTEVLIDVAYQYPKYIDLYKRFPVGPGSKPTFKRIDASKDPSLLAMELAAADFDIGLEYEGKPIRLSAENWEGIGCEFRKYTNLNAGKGRKRVYNVSI